MPSLILASTSAIRQTILRNAGLAFTAKSPEIDERQIIEDAGGEDIFAPNEMAQFLADAKALDISKQNPNAFVIGADQVLGFEGKILHKASSMAQAKERITSLSGKTHHLYAGASICLNGHVIWRHVATSSMRMRDLSEVDIDSYLKKVDVDILFSVGCYQLEGVGATLFEHIEGDFFAILGLPLLPLLSGLRDNGVNV